MKSFFTILILFLFTSYYQAQSPQSLTVDVDWTDTGGTFNTSNGIFTATFNGVVDIAAAYNFGRRREEVQFAFNTNDLGNINMPSQAEWDTYTPSEKGLHLINEERTCRAGLDYGAGNVLGLPFQGVEKHIQDISEYYARVLLDNNSTGHNVDGMTPYARIDGNCKIGTAVSCHEFNSRAENLAYFWTSGATNALVLERSIYNWIYDDASSSWGHRAACLIQDTDPITGSGGFNNNSGAASSEGFLGFAVIGANNGLYNAGLGSWVDRGDIVVMNFFDPVAGSCDYQELTSSTNPLVQTSYAPPTTIAAATTSANRERQDSQGWTHYLDDNGTPTDESDDKLLMSINRKNQYIGTTCDSGFDQETILGGSSTEFVPASTPYVTNPSGWYVISRYWDITPEVQPKIDLDVRHYFLNTDFDDLKTDVGGVLTTGEMTFYKVVGEEPNDHSSIDPGEISFYENAGTSSLTNWLFGSHGSSNSYAEYMVSSFSGGGGGAGVNGGPLLPIELISFDGKINHDMTDLYWNTAMEINNDYFTLERSSDGHDFEIIAEINSLGDTHAGHVYTYTDTRPETGINYYRLKQTDFDGKNEYVGNIIAVDFKSIRDELTVFPNPTSKELNVIFPTESKLDISFELYSVVGKLVQTNIFESNEEQQYQFSLTNLPNGIYLLKSKQGDSIRTTRIFKSN